MHGFGSRRILTIFVSLLACLMTSLGVAQAATSNLALNRPVTGSSDISAGRASNVTDGDLNTHWQPLASDRQDGEVWVCVDLGAPTTFSQAVLRLEDSYASRVKKFELSYSNDEITWNTAYTQDATAHPITAGEPVSFKPVTARYVKLLVFIPDLNFRLQELEIR